MAKIIIPWQTALTAVLGFLLIQKACFQIPEWKYWGSSVSPYSVRVIHMGCEWAVGRVFCGPEQPLLPFFHRSCAELLLVLCWTLEKKLVVFFVWFAFSSSLKKAYFRTLWISPLSLLIVWEGRWVTIWDDNQLTVVMISNYVLGFSFLVATFLTASCILGDNVMCEYWKLGALQWGTLGVRSWVVSCLCDVWHSY